MRSAFLGNHMKNFVFSLMGVAMLAGVVVSGIPAFENADEQAAPIYGIKIPAGDRDWTLISVARIGGNINDMRAKLGNDMAIKAYREKKMPFPDGTIIARLAWRQVRSEENNKDLRIDIEQKVSPEEAEVLVADAFVAGPATNVQFMVKDSKKYASTGGWGFAQFDDGKPANEAVHKTCFPCHEPGKDRDFVFTRYAL